MTYATLNPRNVRLIDVVPFRNGFLRVGAVNNVGHLLGRKPAVPMVNPVVMPALVSGIRIVFCFGSNAQMRRVDARRVIAGVHDDLALWDRANKILVRVAVCAHRLFTRKQENPISVPVVSASPLPTAVGFIKSLLKYIGWAKNCVSLHSFSGVQARVTTAAKFASNAFFMAANRARNWRFALIRHRTSVKWSIYLMPFLWEILL
jgi:hypothetical protein